MDTNIVAKINNTPYKAFFAIAGGGQSFIGDYCRIFGASKTVVGCIIPYDKTVFEKFVGGSVDKFASSEAARKLATASYRECVKAGVDNQYAIGIGAASSVVQENERPDREHKIYVAGHTENKTVVLKAILKQGRTRLEEDSFVAGMIFQMLAHLTIKTTPYVSVRGNESHSFEAASGGIASPIILGESRAVFSEKPSDPDNLLIYPGSWNPMHTAHRSIKKMVEDLSGKPVYLELSIANTDKPSLDFIEIGNRLGTIGNSRYILTDAPTFVDKVKAISDVYPSLLQTYIVGADTWNRIWNEKYGYSVEFLKSFFSSNRVNFIVFGRGSQPLTKVGEEFRVYYPEAEAFNMDISSSAIRKASQAHE